MVTVTSPPIFIINKLPKPRPKSWVSKCAGIDVAGRAALDTPVLHLYFELES